MAKIAGVFSRVSICLTGVLLSAQSLAASPSFVPVCDQVFKAYNQCQKHYQLDASTGDFLLENSVRIQCADGKGFSFYKRLPQMNIASILLYRYPLNTTVTPLTMNGDPGRLRIDALFRNTYGKDSQEVLSHLVTVPFLGTNVSFNRKNGAALAFKKVGELLEAEAKTNDEVKSFLQPWLSKKLIAGTFNWRVVAGTTRLSAHSFATAVDLNNPEEKKNVYWLWDLTAQKKSQLRVQGIHKTSAEITAGINEEIESSFVPQNLAKVPKRVVEIFESQGFIWGGKWYHYDSMHFEYRPEFFKKLNVDCSQEN